CAFSSNALHNSPTKGVAMGTARMGFIASLAVAALAVSGCQNKLHDENRALWQQNRDLQARLASASEPKTDPAQLNQLQSDLAQRDAKINELQSQLRQPTTGQAVEETQLAGIEASYDKAAGRLTVAVPGDVLFAPGDATVRDEAKGTL